MAANNSKQLKKRENRNKNHNKSYLKIALIMVLIILVIVVLMLKPKSEETLKNGETQIIINNEDVTNKVKEELVIENEKIYMSLEDIKMLLDDTIYQEETGEIITTSDRKIACLREGQDEIIINGAKQQVEDVVIDKEGKKYIAISELEDVYDYEFEYIEDTNKITIDKLNKKIIKAKAKKNIKLKKENKTFSTTIEKIPKGTEVTYIQEEGKKVKIRTQNGNIGYVKSNQLENIETEREDFEEEKEKTEAGEYLEYDITKEDITTFEKREKVIDKILQQAIKNDKMYVKIKDENEQNENFERFKIEVKPMLRECGITVEI